MAQERKRKLLWDNAMAFTPAPQLTGVTRTAAHSLPRRSQSCIAPRPATLAPGPQEKMRVRNKSRSAGKGREMHDGFARKHAIVTAVAGALAKPSRGIGSRRGRVAIVARTRRIWRRTARELADETNRRIVPLAADVASKEQVDRMSPRRHSIWAACTSWSQRVRAGGSATATGPIETSSTRI